MFMSYKKFNMKKIRLYLLFSLPFIFPVSVAVSSASKPVVRQSEPVISETIEGIGAVVAVSPDDLRNRFLSGRRGMPFPMDLTTLPENCRPAAGSRTVMCSVHYRRFRCSAMNPVISFTRMRSPAPGRHSSIITGTMYKPDSAVTWKKI